MTTSLYYLSRSAALRAGWNHDAATCYASLRYSGWTALDALRFVEGRR